MHQSIFICAIAVFLITAIAGQRNFPSTLVELRGLWCISQWNNRTKQYSQQLGQAFFYNNETFTWNLLNNIKSTWLNHFVAISQTDSNGTYQAFINTTHDTKTSPFPFINNTSCVWLRRLFNGDIIWGRQLNGTCTVSFEDEPSAFSIRYTRNHERCRLFDDEDSHRELSNTKFDRELVRFDQSLPQEKRQSIVFFGSSSIRLWSTLAIDFPTVQNGVINRGFGGSTMKLCWQQFKRIVLPLEPRVLIIYVGGNDLESGTKPANIESLFLRLITTIRRFYPSLPIAYISIKPSPSRFDKLSQTNDTNNRIRNAIQKMKNVDFINIFDEMLTSDKKLRPELYGNDHLHMNAQGYAIWTRAVNEYLTKKRLISKATMDRQTSFFMEKIVSIFYVLFLLLLLKLFHAKILKRNLKNLMFYLKGRCYRRFIRER